MFNKGTTPKHLDKLIKDVNAVRKSITYQVIDMADCAETYMSTKGTSFVGFKQGYSDCLTRNEKNMKESDKIRSTTKDYLKFIHNKDGELVQVDSVRKGRVDCLFQVYWIDGVRYLFPFSGEGGYYPTHTFVTKYKDNCVVEEYMVNGNQIVYESYTYKKNKDVEYSYMNYVSGGKHPILEERKGKFQLEPLAYEETFYDSWLNHR